MSLRCSYKIWNSLQTQALIKGEHYLFQVFVTLIWTKEEPY